MLPFSLQTGEHILYINHFMYYLPPHIRIDKHSWCYNHVVFNEIKIYTVAGCAAMFSSHGAH